MRGAHGVTPKAPSSQEGLESKDPLVPSGLNVVKHLGRGAGEMSRSSSPLHWAKWRKGPHGSDRGWPASCVASVMCFPVSWGWCPVEGEPGCPAVSSQCPSWWPFWGSLCRYLTRSTELPLKGVLLELLSSFPGKAALTHHGLRDGWQETSITR